MESIVNVLKDITQRAFLLLNARNVIKVANRVQEYKQMIVQAVDNKMLFYCKENAFVRLDII